MGLGIASHPFLGFPKRDNGYFGFLNVTKNYSAVTAACLLTKRQLFNELGGFDEKNLGVAYNDVDYCLRLRERGFLITYTPYAKLYHYESLSRGFDNEDDIKKKDPKKYQRIISERKYMLEKWKKVIKNDPYYNPNLTRLQNNFGIKIGPEDVRYI
jgi:GT2 family glycosyltransferase